MFGNERLKATAERRRESGAWNWRKEGGELGGLRNVDWMGTREFNRRVSWGDVWVESQERKRHIASCWSLTGFESG